MSTATESKTATISRDQFKRLTENLLKESSTILKASAKSDKAMDKKSALLQALLFKLREKLGLPSTREALTTRGFKTYEFSYREAVYELALQHAKEPFDYQKIVDSFLKRALKE
jgi:hypothetical protein